MAGRGALACADGVAFGNPTRGSGFSLGGDLEPVTFGIGVADIEQGALGKGGHNPRSGAVGDMHIEAWSLGDSHHELDGR